MADDHTQQTRVLLVNGQTIILQGDPGDNSINEINADLLQQALQEVSGSAEDGEEGNENEYSATLPEPDTNSDNFVAIFHGSQTDGQTIQLTVQQAEALGIHFSVDDDGKSLQQQDIPQDVPDSIHIGDSSDHLVYPESTLGNSDNFQDCVSVENTCQNGLKSEQSDDGHQLQTSMEGMEAISSDVGAFIGNSENQNITLIPEFVDGQISYTVKLNGNQPENDVLQDSHFTALDEDTKSGIALIQTSSSTATISPPTSSVVASAVNLNGITTSLSTAVSSVSSSQSIQLNEYQCSRTSAANISATDKKQKLSYVLLPSSSTSGNSVLSTKLSGSQGTRLTETFHALCRNQLLSGNTVIASQNKNTFISAPSTGTTTQIGTVNALGGVPIVSPSPSIVRTSCNSLVSSTVSTTLTGGGMIRVVAGGGTNRLVQQTSTSGSKLSSILSPAATTKLVTTTNSSTGQKIVSFNSSSNKVATGTTSDAVSNAVSAALTRMPVPNFNSTKPLGSSENPIQLVQHGQTFHSVQSLSQEQLRQIATVLQQQHLESAPRTKNVLYDAETNTRIIYRVVYPEDLDLRESKSPGDVKLNSLTNSSGRGRGRRGRPPKSSIRGGFGRGGMDSSLSSGRKPGISSVDLDLDEDRLLDDTSKGEKKKQVARTRSGRLSRPPRHMVKDYKRLHHLDFADADLDDSDGGYSDYQMSDHESEEVAEKATPKELLPGLVVPKRKISSHFRCPTCQKIYLGHSRMARHFEQYPDHGSIEQLQVPTQNNNNNSSNNNNNNNNSSNTNTIINSATDTPVPPPSPVDQPGTPDIHEDKFTSIGTSHPNGILRTGPARRRGKRRGPWSHLSPEIRSERRKVKLREVIGTCEANELSEVAGPAVAGLLSLWDLLLLRVEAVRAEETYIATLFDQLRILLKKVRAVVSDILRPMDSKCNGYDDEFELQDEMLCSTLGVACGRYWVDDRKLRYRQYSSNKDFNEPITKRSRMEEPPQKEPTERSNKVSCPELLSALALNATANIKMEVGSVTSVESCRSSPDAKEDSEESSKVSVSVHSDDGDNRCVEQDEEEDHHEFLLNNASDMCVEELAQSAGDKQVQQDLQTVDDLVNERLKNLTGFSTSCETVSDLPKDSDHSGSELIGSLERFNASLQQEGASNNSVPSFDPEIALAAMGEGDQGNTSEPTQFSTCMDSVASAFDPEIALAAMGEGEQPISNASSPHDSFPSSLPVIESVRGSVGTSAFTPEMALAAMGEGDQTSVKTVCSTYRTSMQQLEADVTSSFNSTIDISAIASPDRPEVHNQFPSLSQSGSVTGDNQNTFDADMALAVIDNREQAVESKTTSAQYSSTISNTFSTALSDVTDRETSSSVTVSSFDPEIALAAMGEGDEVVDSTPTEHSHIHFESSLPPNAETVSSDNTDTFDPEIALAAMGEGPADVSSTTQFSQPAADSVTSVEQSLVNSETFQLTGLADSAMDVSLDGSGPELDFEVLSEEFNQNTRHS